MNQATRDAVREGAKRSASIILPLVFDTLGVPEAMLDVGAGEGWWAREAHALGVPNVSMLDYEPIHEWGVEEWDAGRGLPLPLQLHGNPTMSEGDRWPLVLCLEMAEHVSPWAGDHLVAELCRVSTEIIWSAAIPGQGGDGHINEQWPAYWAERFNRHGWHLYDPGWRHEVWDNPGVEPWYAQNLLCAYSGGNLQAAAFPPLALVHPVTWAHHRGVPAPGI